MSEIRTKTWAVLVAALVHFTPVQAVTHSTEEKGTAFCEALVMRPYFDLESVKNPIQTCLAYVNSSAKLARTIEFMHCFNVHIHRTTSQRYDGVDPEPIRQGFKPECAKDESELASLINSTIDKTLDKAPWKQWPTKDQSKLPRFIDPKDRSTWQYNFEPPRKPKLLKDYHSATLSVGFGEGRTIEGFGREAIEEELRNRGFFTEAEWQAIYSRRLKEGMKLEAAFAAFSPKFKTITKGVASGEELIPPIHIYRCGGLRNPALPFCPFTQVNSIDGKISKIGPADINYISK